MDWIFEGSPTVAGWYATLLCWDAEEGIFTGARLWDGSAWSTRAVVAFAGAFPDETTATDWAYENDPERL